MIYIKSLKIKETQPWSDTRSTHLQALKIEGFELFNDKRQKMCYTVTPSS